MLFNRLPALAAALLSSLVLSRAAGAQPAGGAADPRLDKLEDRLFMHSYAYEDAGSRLDRLEQMVFGQKMSGSPPGRIARLTAAVPGWDDKDGVGRRAAASQVSDPPPPVLRPPLPGPLANSPAGASGAGQTDPSPPGTGQSGPALRPFMAGGGAGSGDGGVFVRRRRSAGPTAIAETADRSPPGGGQLYVARMPPLAPPIIYGRRSAFAAVPPQAVPGNRPPAYGMPSPAPPVALLRQRLTALEVRTFGASYDGQPLEYRINRLEQAVFRRVSGAGGASLPARIDRLAAACPARSR